MLICEILILDNIPFSDFDWPACRPWCFFMERLKLIFAVGLVIRILVHEFSVYSRPSLKLRSRRPILSVSK